MSEYDNCIHCTLRCNIKACNAVTCNEHASWYAQTKIARIKELEAEITELKSINVDHAESFCDLEEERDQLENAERKRRGSQFGNNNTQVNFFGDGDE